MTKYTIRKIIIVIIVVLTTNGYADSKKSDFTTNSKTSLFYTINKKGLFKYTLEDANTIQVLDLKEDFLDNSLRYINDTLISVGYGGKILNDQKPRLDNLQYYHIEDGDTVLITSPVYDNYLYYSQTFYIINTNTLQTWKYKVLDYEHKDMDTLRTKTTLFSMAGDVTSSTIKTTRCSSISNSSAGLRFCENTGRFYSISDTINNKQVFSREGSLYLLSNNRERCILKYKGHFEPKFGSGYFQPTISPNGDAVVYLYAAGFLKSGSGLFQLDMKTKKSTEISKGSFSDPLYSPDGKYLLVGKNKRSDKLTDTWIKDIYMYDLINKTDVKIGEGDLYLWAR